MIEYSNSTEYINEDMLDGFFVGWTNPPNCKKHMEILQGSYCFWIAIDKEAAKIVGFITAISDGILSAYIPLLEVLPEYQNSGIGKELVKYMLSSLENLYMIDLLCDPILQSYYKQFGMHEASGSLIRNYSCQSCE